MPSEIRLSELKVGTIINTSSGGCDSESEQKIFSILTRAGIVEPRVWCGSADEMTRSFVEATGQNLDVLVVFGGDGTIRTAAEACAEKGRYLTPLPGGTMNMLPRALYGDVAWEGASALSKLQPRTKLPVTTRSSPVRHQYCEAQINPEIRHNCLNRLRRRTLLQRSRGIG